MKKVFSEVPLGVVAAIPGRWPEEVRSGVQEARHAHWQDIRHDRDALMGAPKVGI